MRPCTRRRYWFRRAGVHAGGGAFTGTLKKLRRWYERALAHFGSLGCNHVMAICLTFGGYAFSGLGEAPAGNLHEVSPPSVEPTRQERYEALARHYAPAFYHDTDSSYYVGDYLTRFNFDGDYNGKNNWENLERFATVPAYVYYAVSETKTHYFINYAVFHPRDWHEWDPLDRHENDLEGVSLAITKSGEFGEVVALETLAHADFWQYSNLPSVSPGLEVIDGPITFRDGSHPRVYVEAKGHGIYGCDSRCEHADDGDGLLYEVGQRAESPQGGSGDYTSRVRYALIAMDSDGSSDGNQGLWYRRDDICDTCTFGEWGKLRGDNYGQNRAQTPWGWRNKDNTPVRRGDMLCDPAFFFDAHLNGAAFGAGFSHEYVSHAFRTHVAAQGEFAPMPLAYRPRGFELAEPTPEHSLCRPSPSQQDGEPDKPGPRVAALKAR